MRAFIVIVTLACALVVAAPARAADEELLRGPHPFIKDNQVSLHAGGSLGAGDSARGLRVQADFTSRWTQAIWADVQMGVVNGRCRADQSVCGNGGNTVDIVGGVAWKFQTNLPLVPYARAAAGPTFLFPDGARSVAGFLVRGGVGAHYFLFDWFGLGAEFAGDWGMAFFGNSAHRTGTLGGVDASLGVALQF